MKVTLDHLQDWNACQNVLDEIHEKLGWERLESGFTLLEALDAGMSIRTVVWAAMHLSSESRIAFLEWMADCAICSPPIFEFRGPGTARTDDIVAKAAAVAEASWANDVFDAGEIAWITAAAAWIAAAAKDPASSVTEDAISVAATERQRQRAPLRARQRARLRECLSDRLTETPAATT